MQTPIPSPAIPIALVLCLWGALADHAYKKAGGAKPDKFQKQSLLAAIVVCVLVLVLAVVGVFLSPGAAGTLTPLLLVVIFGVWEIQRLRVRRTR